MAYSWIGGGLKDLGGEQSARVSQQPCIEFHPQFVIKRERRGVSLNSQTSSYTYDSVGRLLSVTQGTQTEAYTYDLQGNRTVIDNGTVGSYDAQDRLLTWSSDGNLQNRGDASFSYDLLGNLKSVVMGANTYTYAVDGRNRRIAKKVNGALQKGWLYQNSLNPLAELDSQNRVTAQFIYGDRSNVPSYMVKTMYASATDTAGTQSTYRIISDHLGSVRAVVDSATGAIAQTLTYDTWGKVTSDSNPGFQPFGFAGGLYDPDTQLIRFGARDYDPETGRWTSKDPIQFAGGDVNLYGYVLGDPVNNIDPGGEDPVGVIVGGIVGAIQGGIGATLTPNPPSAADVVAGVIGGAVGGALSGAWGGGIVGGVINGAGDLIQQEALNIYNGKSLWCINYGELAGATIGGILGAKFSKMGEEAGSNKTFTTWISGYPGLVATAIGSYLGDALSSASKDCECN